MSNLHTPRKGALGADGSPVDMARCRVSVHDGGRWSSFHQCRLSKKVERDGIGYCTKHDPENAKRRDAARAKAREDKDRWEREHRVRWALQDATIEQLQAEIARREGGAK